MENDKCGVCGTVYETSKWGCTPDSHETYTEYFECPECGYTEELRELIGEIFKEKMKISFSAKGHLKVNREKLGDLVLEVIKEKWPKKQKNLPKK
jgi:rubredoxin